jgi:hypothetical protein
VACSMQQPMASIGGRCPRKGTESTLRSSPFYRHRALS